MNAVIVIYCTNKQTMAFERVKAFPETPSGNRKADALFSEWVETHANNRDKERMPVMALARLVSERLEDGYYEMGDGYISILHTT